MAIFLRGLGAGLSPLKLREPGTRGPIVLAPLALGVASKDHGH